MTRRRVIGALLGVVLLLLPSACRQAESLAGTLRVEWTLTPPVPIVDQASSIAIVIYDGADVPALDADLDLEAHMTHPGMAPAVVPLAAAGEGRYHASITFTMTGDWVLMVRGHLRDGRAVRQRIGELIVRSAG